MEEERDRRIERVWRRRERERAATTSGRVYLGPMTRVCHHCQILRLPSEPLNCCHNEKVSLPPLGDYPSTLKDLFTDSITAESSNFQDNIRQYYSVFFFASFKLIVLWLYYYSGVLLCVNFLTVFL